MSSELVKQKQTNLSGSHVNYYLSEIIDRYGRIIVAEAEDIIEYFNMNFALATVFKSVWRMCKLRQDLGKPGSSMLYEAQKVKYYAERTLAFADKQDMLHMNMGVLGRFFRITGHLLMCEGVFAPIGDEVKIAKPKRLQPYSFNIYDLVASLKPTDLERQVLTYTLRIAQNRNHPRIKYQRSPMPRTLLMHAEKLEQREVIATGGNSRPSRSEMSVFGRGKGNGSS